MKKLPLAVAGGVLLFGSGIAHAAGGQEKNPDALANEIVVIANGLPADSSQGAYEARIALALDNSGTNCAESRSALLIASQKVQGRASSAMQRLWRTLSTCGTGTGGIGGGRNSAFGAVGFSVGGGSDYIR